MKTTLLIITMLFALTAIGQNTMKAIQKKDSTTQIVKSMQPEKVADKIITLDSSNKVNKKTIAVQNDTIQAKSEQIKVIKENSVPVGNGNGAYILIAIVIGLAGVFIITKYKKTIGTFLTINEKDLIKGTVIAFIMALLTSLYAIVNTGSIPVDWPTWRMILISSLSTGIAYLIKNLLESTKKKIEVPATQPVVIATPETKV